MEKSSQNAAVDAAHKTTTTPEIEVQVDDSTFSGQTSTDLAIAVRNVMYPLLPRPTLPAEVVAVIDFRGIDPFSREVIKISQVSYK
jgi:hypothetical protein